MGWKAEGSEMCFEPMRGGNRAFTRSIENIAESLEVDKSYAIVRCVFLSRSHSGNLYYPSLYP